MKPINDTTAGSFINFIESKGTVESALSLVSWAFEGKPDKGGESYINHLIHVWQAVKNLGYDKNFQLVAILHDILEDTKISYTFLVEEYGVMVAQSVLYLTKSKDRTLEEYTVNLSKDKIATVVKIEDLKHNLDIKRLNRKLDKSDLKRINNYIWQLNYLETKKHEN